MLILETDGSNIIRRLDDQGINDALPLIANREGVERKGLSAANALADWTKRYTDAVASGSDPAIFVIGREMYRWLDQNGALSDWVVSGERVMEIRQNPATADGLGDALLAAPWEILVYKDRFLVSETSLFTVARRCSSKTEPIRPKHADLMLMFMAAAPEGQSSLDHEHEEAAILEATRATALRAPLAHVQVEESGALEFLSDRLRLDGPFDVLHLSCHGNITGNECSLSEPVLLLETDEGDANFINPDRFITGLRDKLPPMVFLSACRSAERGSASRSKLHDSPGITEEHLRVIPTKNDGNATIGPELADPFVRRLAKQTLNVLGWDRSVSDIDATKFSEALYGSLSRGETVPRAAAAARRDLFRAHGENSDHGKHWHMARVYLGPGGGGPLTDPSASTRPAKEVAETAFLDAENKLAPVAKRTEFVGRRKQIQQVIRAYRNGAKGVLVHGMGNLGKSSVAARVADRMLRHRTAVVVGECSAREIFEGLKRVVRSIVDGREDRSLTRRMRDELTDYDREVSKDVGSLEDVVRQLLKRTLSNHPVLLVLDDFEKSLEAPSADPNKRVVVVKPAFREPLLALFRAFNDVHSQSCLLLTSRYDFELTDHNGKDLAKPLFRVPLAPMQPTERMRQWSAKARAADKEAKIVEFAGLLELAAKACGGNPGLLDVLTRPILKGEKEAAQRAISTVENFRETGESPPDSADVGDFFKRMAFKEYADALSTSERTVLGAAGYFQEGLPIPIVALEAAANERGVSEPGLAINRLLALGMLDDWGNLRTSPSGTYHAHASVNPLSRHLGKPVTDDEATAIAKAALLPIANVWRDADGDFPIDHHAVEAARIALATETPDPPILEAATRAAVKFFQRESRNARAALEAARPALAVLATANHPPSITLLLDTILAAEEFGDVELQDELIEVSLARRDIDRRSEAFLLGQKANRLLQQGDLQRARLIREKEQLPIYRELGNKRQIAVTMGKIADILFQQGDLTEAQRIREKEELPVYRELGEKISIAVTKGKIASILFAQGKLDEALRIREQEELPVYRELSEARRLREHEELPFYLELAEAQRIHEQEQIPVFRELGDQRSVAVAMGQIAEILVRQGNFDRARHTLEVEQLPILRELGDRRSIAVTMGKIADILFWQGDLAQARRIREEEQLPVFRELGDRREIAVTMGQIADILFQQGDLAEARRIREEEQLPVFRELGDRREIAVTMGQIADTLFRQGEFDDALETHLERLDVAREMHDIDTIAHIRFSCAQIRVTRGDLEKGEAQTIVDELSEAFQISLELQRPDAIGAIGQLLGQVLAGGGLTEEACQVLAITADAFDKLGHQESAASCRALIDQIKGGSE